MHPAVPYLVGAGIIAAAAGLIWLMNRLWPLDDNETEQDWIDRQW